MADIHSSANSASGATLKALLATSGHLSTRSVLDLALYLSSASASAWLGGVKEVGGHEMLARQSASTLAILKLLSEASFRRCLEAELSGRVDGRQQVLLDDGRTLLIVHCEIRSLKSLPREAKHLMLPFSDVILARSPKLRSKAQVRGLCFGWLHS